MRKRFWTGLLSVLVLIGTVGAQDYDGIHLPWAGSYDGSFTWEGSDIRGGTLTLVVRQSEGILTGRMAMEVEGNCIQTSEFVTTLRDSGLEAIAWAIDSSDSETALRARLFVEEEQLFLMGAFTTRACSSTIISGQFTLRKLAGTNPPDLNGTYEGGFWNIVDNARSFGFIRSRSSGWDYLVDEVGITTPLGLVTGTARGQINEQGDRIEDLTMTLSVAGTTLTIIGELSVSGDGRIVFGPLRTPPGELIELKGGMLMRRR